MCTSTGWSVTRNRRLELNDRLKYYSWLANIYALFPFSKQHSKAAPRRVHCSGWPPPGSRAMHPAVWAAEVPATKRAESVDL